MISQEASLDYLRARVREEKITAEETLLLVADYLDAADSRLAKRIRKISESIPEYRDAIQDAHEALVEVYTGGLESWEEESKGDPGAWLKKHGPIITDLVEQVDAAISTLEDTEAIE